MTIRAAGILFLTPGNKALFLKRGTGGDHPNEWCFPGGRQEDGETLLECALREAIEECGAIPDGDRVEWTRRIATDVAALPNSPEPPEVDFTTFLQRVDAEFAPQVNGEHTGWAWVDVAAPPEPLHPGCAVALQRFGMDELGVARAIAAGQLTSPQRYQNVWLFDLRITGTGAAYRRGLDEFVWRDPSMYLNDDFVARCNGLPVIFEHPEKSMLDSDEYRARNVGSIFLPYVKGDDVRGVAKIFDSDAVEILLNETMSTSPAVVLKPGDGQKLKLENGSDLLIEGQPALLDHVAICPAGVWDKGGKPSGVAVATQGDVMTEEEKAAAAKKDAEEKERKDAEEKARADAAMGETLDKMLKKMDAMEAKMDAMDKKDANKTDTEKKEEEDRKDAARRRRDAMAFGRRKDAESEEDYKKRLDAEEGSLAKNLEEEGEPKEMAADRAKRARKDAEEKERVDSERRDSQTLDTVVKKVGELAAAMPKARADDESKELAVAQARADAVYGAWGERAPRPLDGETVLDYRKRLLMPYMKHSAGWKSVNIAKFDADALGVAETQVYADAQRAADHPSVGDGMLIPRSQTLDSGHRVTRFVGDSAAFINRFAPNKQVGHFKTRSNQQ